jgi:hypothetical protein
MFGEELYAGLSIRLKNKFLPVENPQTGSCPKRQVSGQRSFWLSSDVGGLYKAIELYVNI